MNESNQSEISKPSLSEQLRVILLHKKNLQKTIDEGDALFLNLKQLKSQILVDEKKTTERLKKISIQGKEEKNTKKRKRIEEQRWKEAEGWYDLKTKMWGVEDALSKNIIFVEESKREIASLACQEYEIRYKIEEEEILSKKEESRSSLESLSEDLEKKVIALALIQEQRNKLCIDLDILQKNESEIEKTTGEITDLLTVAKSSAEERDLVNRRYALEKERHEIEVSKWKAEENLDTVKKNVVVSEEEMSDIKQHELEVRNNLLELDTKLKDLEKSVRSKIKEG